MRILIRQTNLNLAKNRQAYQAMLNAYAQDKMGMGKPLDGNKLQQIVEDLKQLPNAVLYLAFDEKVPIGFATCFSAYSTFRAKPILNIHDIAVVPEYRGKGIGRQLLQHINQDAKDNGYCKVTLEVREDNPLADGLYRSEGFTSAEINGKQVQYLFLEKLLND